MEARKTADAIIDRLLDRAAGYAVISTSERETVAEIVRAALLAERLAQIERDATIAETLATYSEISTVADWYRHVRRIARAIRSQTPYEKETK